MSERLREMHLKADGIVCKGCAGDMENILLDKDGIEDVSVSFMEDFIKVKYDPDIIDRKHVYLAVRKLGFPAKIVLEK
jgi:copper chaperone CopZ